MNAFYDNDALHVYGLYVSYGVYGDVRDDYYVCDVLLYDVFCVHGVHAYGVLCACVHFCDGRAYVYVSCELHAYDVYYAYAS